MASTSRSRHKDSLRSLVGEAPATTAPEVDTVTLAASSGRAAALARAGVRPRRARWGRPLLLVIATLLLPRAARADDRKDAQIEMEKASVHLGRKEYESAIARFNVARKLAPTASGPLFGLGVAYAQTDRCREAVAYLEEYLQRQKAPKPEASIWLSSCKKKLVRLKITTDPPGAEVRFDAEDSAVVGTTPLEYTQLAAGQHRVYLSLPKHRQHVADVVVEPGVLSWVSAKLEELAALPALPTDPPPTEPGPAVAPPTTDPTRPPVDPNRQPTLHDPASPIQSSEPLNATRPEPARPAPEAAKPPAAVEVRLVDAELDVAASDEQASVFVNGQSVASDGHARLRLPPGLYGVSVTRDGFRGAESAVTLAAGDRKAFKGDVKPLKNHGFLNMGVTFTILGLLVEGGAVAGHFLADREFRDTPAYDNFDHFHNLELYGQVAAGVCGGLALLGYILEAATNRGHVEEGKSFPLSPIMWPVPAKGAQ